MLKQSLSYLSSTVVVIAVNFLTLPYFTRYLSLSDYGVLALFILFGSITTNLSSFGLSQAAYRFYFKYEIERFRLINFTIIAFLIAVFSILGVLFIIPGAEWISTNVFSKEISSDLLKLSFFSGCLQYFYLYFSNLLAAQKRANSVAFLLILHAFNIAAVTFYLISWQSMTYMALIYGLFFANFVSFFLSVILNLKLSVFRFSWRELVASIRFSYPEVPGVLMGLLYSSFDKGMLANYRGAGSIGYYEFGSKFAVILKHFMDALSRSWGPYFMEHAEKGKPANYQAILKRFYELVFIIAFVGLLVSYFAEEALIILTTEEFYKAKYLVPLLALQYLFGTLGFLSAHQVLFAGKLIYNLPVAAVALSINISLNIVLIPLYGALGAVLATVCASFVNSIFHLYLGNKAFFLPFNSSRLIKFSLLVVSLLLVIYPLMALNILFFYKVLIKSLLLVFYIVLGIKIMSIDLAVLKQTFFNLGKRSL